MAITENKNGINVIKTENTQWLYYGNKLLPMGRTTPILPAGVYNIEYDVKYNKFLPISKDFNSDELFVLPTSSLNSIINDIHSFWKNEEKYIKYKSVYKRGILLYGPPGCGKSSIIMLLMKEIILKHDGVVLTPHTIDQFIGTINVLSEIIEIEPKKKIMIILEDIDNWVMKGSSAESLLINFLDGGASYNGVVTIATTNNPEVLQERMFNRPSRFDRRYYIDKPNAESRRFYIEHKLEKSDLKNINIDDIVDKTEGFTIDHLKEYIISVFVLGYSHEDAMSEVLAILKTKSLKSGLINEDKVGFKD